MRHSSLLCTSLDLLIHRKAFLPVIIGLCLDQGFNSGNQGFLRESEGRGPKEVRFLGRQQLTPIPHKLWV